MPEEKHGINPALMDTAVDIDSVFPHPENYNTHDLNTLKESLRTNGQYRPIVVQTSTNLILAGNGTYAAARALGWTHIAASFADVDDEAARRVLLVDNFAATDDYDTEQVLKILEELGGSLTGTGIGQDDFEKMVASLNGGNADEDASGKLDEAYGFSVIVEADDERHQAELLEIFEGMSLTCRAFTM